MKRVSVNVQEKFLEFIDKIVKLELYPSRNEVIREALKDWISNFSVFLSNFNSDTKKLSELHRKFVEINEQLKQELFPCYSVNKTPLFPLEKRLPIKKHGD